MRIASVLQFCFWLTVLFNYITVNSFAHGKDEIPLLFVQNKGQWDNRALFRVEQPSGVLFFEKSAFTYHLYDAELRNNLHTGKLVLPADSVPTLQHHAFKMQFLNSLNATAQGKKKASHFHNYYIGNDESKWASNVPLFEGISYKNFYKNIDLEVYTHFNNIKYDFVLEAGADASQIAWKYEGVNATRIHNGKLYIETALGEIIELEPVAWNIHKDKKKHIRCEYREENGVFSFHFPDGYNNKQQLVIDPILVFSTFSGSTGTNFGFTATYDDLGYLYSGSSVFGLGYPTTLGAFQTTFGGGSGSAFSGSDIAITKWDTNGSQPIYSTYLGGSGDELPHSMFVNENFELYVMSTTSSLNFPMHPSGFDTSFNINPNSINPVNLSNGLGVVYTNGSDIVITRFNSTGTALLGGTYLGGTHNDGLNLGATRYNYADEVRGEIQIDKYSNVYVVSSTYSHDNPVGQTTSYQQTKPAAAGNQDGIIYKLNGNLTQLQWSAYLGGSGVDAIYSIALDRNQDIIVSGGTNTLSFPTTTGAFQQAPNPGINGFVTKIVSSGAFIFRSTYYGAPSYVQSYFVETDRFDNIYIFGQTTTASGNLIYNAAYHDSTGGQFVAKFDPFLDTLIWSTRFGQNNNFPNISPTAFMVDLCSSIYLSGWGGNITMPMLTTNGLDTAGNPFQGTTDGHDFYLMVLADDASQILYGSFMGGISREHVDGGTCRFDRKGKIYHAVCAGCPAAGIPSNSTFPSFPNPGAHSNVNGAVAANGCNLAVFKMDFLIPVAVADFQAPNVGCAPFAVNFNNNSLVQGNNPSFFWSFGDGNTSTLPNPTHTYTTSGVFTIQLVVIDSGSCNINDTITKTISVFGSGTSTLPDVLVCNGQGKKIGFNAVTLPPNVTFSWFPTTFLSNSLVPDPIANPPVSTTYFVLLDNGICNDTVFQRVVVDSVLTQTTPDTAVCSSELPINLWGSGLGSGSLFTWSTSRNISDTLNANSSDSIISVAPDSAYNFFYFRVISDSGCVGIDSTKVTIVDQEEPLIAEFQNPGAGCAPYSVAFFNITTLQQNTQFIWYFGNGDSSLLAYPVYTFPTSGQYTVILTARDTTACIQTDTFEMVINVGADTSYGINHLICEDVPSTIGVNPNNYPNSAFQWQQNIVSNTNIANPTVTLNQDTILQLIIQGQCVDTVFDTIHIEYVFAQAPDTLISCSDELPLAISGASAGSATSFLWSTNAQFTDSIPSINDSTVQVRPDTGIAMYYLRTTSPIGCFALDSTLLVVSDLAVIIPPDTGICLYDTLWLEAINLIPQNTLSYDWAPQNLILTDNTLSGIRVAPQQNTLYNLSTVNDSGCVGNYAVEVRVSTLDSTQIQILSTSDTLVRSTAMQLEALPNESGRNYVWSPPTGLSSTSGRIVMASPRTTTTYTVMVGDDENEFCVYPAQKTIVVSDLICADPEIFVPNAFSPDADGLNDEVFVRGRFIESLFFQIYNRWGELVFETRDQQRGWNGTHRGEIATPDVYVYYLEAFCIDGQRFEKKGNITLIR